MIKVLFNKIFNAIFNRFTITALIILLQFGYFVLLFGRVIDSSGWINNGFRVLALILAIYIVWRDYNPAYKISWIFLLGVVPQMGAALYLLFGNKRPSKSLKRKLDPVEQKHRSDLRQSWNAPRYSANNRLMSTVDYITELGPYPAWSHTETKYYPVGEEMFEDLIADLEKAEHFIFLEYFIISKGQLWDRIYDILTRKAEEGVDVRVIYDDIGSIGTVPKSLVRKHRKDKIKVMAFNTMRPFLSLVYNNRDHRKIAVIDGYMGYTGGVNIADEYANLEERFGHWKDTGIRLYGEGVWNMTVMFLVMWNAFKETDPDFEQFGPHVWHPEAFPSDGVVQPFSDTPLDNENLGENIYMEIINQAEDYVFIYTPYLIPDNEMLTALMLAAKRGVDVRLVTPGVPDKKLVYTFTRSHYAALVEAGVKIYEYTPGFLHGKVIVSDDNIAVVGTINIDYRSLYLHFECGTLLMDNSSIMDIRSDCIETIGKSHQINQEDLKKIAYSSAMAAVLRVASPIL